MIKLTSLELDLTSGKIDNDIGRWISSGLSNLKNLTELNLSLWNNEIRNVGFEESSNYWRELNLNRMLNNDWEVYLDLRDNDYFN